MATKRTKDVRDYLIDQIDRDDRDLVRHAQVRFGITRQAVNRHLRDLIAQGAITAEGQTRQRIYALVPITSGEWSFPISPDLHEDQIWRDQIRPRLDGVPPNPIAICQYGFTVMLNNAVDHSEGTQVVVSVKRTAAAAYLAVHDNGIGIFRKLKRDLNLDDERYTLLELSKGKLTTDPAHHTDEGIFFTSRAFDHFTMEANGLLFTHDTLDRDWLMGDRASDAPGTAIEMKIGLRARRTLPEVLERFASSEEGYGFSRTIVPVVLAQYGDENLISRSQAKRLLMRFDRFKEVLLDFKGVEFIGRAFADEVFRVFHGEHPEVILTWINANPSVESMILGARAAPLAPSN